MYSVLSVGGVISSRKISEQLIKWHVDTVFLNELNFRLYILKARIARAIKRT